MAADYDMPAFQRLLPSFVTAEPESTKSGRLARFL